ncbi:MULTISPECIES: RNA polymerase sigma factor [unclassified Rathayibacter]|uniref:RNA polymerase sigma factor n=1 Tax=unclassified Rathayibacter TaxID=2609250 RepID=UPI0010E2058E|nr:MULTISPECIES: RNA polymerase sigma factor [unclassified Rathayibacter]MCJ1703730.1 RNA polymerase sigma factor [Rathayibacter sp. VKM Ac-2926]TCL83576.1 RNA polymerase sigma-70 factor (ECF subfamily) [Rathayibacter sp. PhB192]TCM29169.1 RNA polymerase sigma-70 factor (ECF subfamily) [Rathayibacter sp. PhB179]
MSRRDTQADRIVAILDATARDLLNYLERRVGTDDAADALSETMTIAWRRSSSMPLPDEDARLWLFGVARNVALNTSRTRRRQDLLAEKLRGIVDPIGVIGEPSDVVLDVRAALSKLTPELAEVVRLVHWEGFSLSEAAQILSVPPSTARSRYQKAKRELGDLLSPLPSEQALGSGEIRRV